MVSRILTTLLITSLSLCGFCADYQIANKASAGLQIMTASMPTSAWTNSVLWLTADSPVLNSGATNANWICYAKTCSGNAFHLDPNKQPSRVLTNGAWALRFDGSDDFLLSPTSASYSGTNSWTLSGWIDLAGSWPIANNSRAIFAVGNFSTSNEAWAVYLRGPAAPSVADTMTLIVSSNGTTPAITAGATIPKASVTNGWVHIAVICRTGRYFRFVANGVSSGEHDAGASIFQSSSSLSIADFPTGATPFRMNLADCSLYNVAISTNDITAIFNSTKSRYGK